MSSVLKVDAIQNTAGTTAMTIDSSGIVSKPNVVAWLVNKNAVQTSSGTNELITFQTVTLNQGSGFQTSGSNANKFVAPVHGIYTTAATLLSVSGTDNDDVFLMKNNAGVIRFRNTSASGHESYGFTWVGELDAGDTLHLAMASTSRSVYGDTSTNQYWSTWCGHLIG